MPRNGSGIYSLPASYQATTGETITALQHNAPLTDIAADLNAVRPISAGGTGASTASAARTALGLQIGSDVQAYNSGLVPMPVGAVLPYAGSTEPSGGWLFCYGQAISRTTYAALFAVLSTTYGSGDGSTTFNLPDLRGRVIAGQDDMGGTSANRLTNQTGGLDGDTLGASGGAETHTLTEAQMPAHTHSVTGTAASNGSHTHTLTGADTSSAGGASVERTTGASNGTVTSSSDGAHTHSVTGTAASTGGGGAHNNVQPTIILNYIMKV